MTQPWSEWWVGCMKVCQRTLSETSQVHYKPSGMCYRNGDWQKISSSLDDQTVLDPACAKLDNNTFGLNGETVVNFLGESFGLTMGRKASEFKHWAVSCTQTIEDIDGIGNVKVSEKKRKDADMEECIQHGSTQLLLCKKREQEASKRRGNEHRWRKGRAKTRSKDWLEMNPLLHQHRRTGEKLHQWKGWKMQRCSCGVHPVNRDKVRN